MNYKVRIVGSLYAFRRAIANTPVTKYTVKIGVMYNFQKQVKGRK